MALNVTFEQAGKVTDDKTGKKGDGFVFVVNGVRRSMTMKSFFDAVGGALTMMGEQAKVPPQAAASQSPVVAAVPAAAAQKPNGPAGQAVAAK